VIRITSHSRAGHATLGSMPRARKRTVLRIAGLLGARLDGDTEPGDAGPSSDALRRHAAQLAAALAGTGGTSERWHVPRFAREVARVRRHLQPIWSHEALAESYGRESFRLRTSLAEAHGAATLAGSPVEVAYALRWLELEGRIDRAPWLELLARRDGSPAA